MAASKRLIQDLLDLLPAAPDRNCSCHISPPCGDCVEWGRQREVEDDARAALSAPTTIEAAQRMLPEVPEAHAYPNMAPRLFTGFDIGPFFVHQAISDDEILTVNCLGHGTDTWHVTHRRSGFAIQKRIPTHARAIWLARNLCTFDVWSADTKPALLAGMTEEQVAAISVLRADSVSGDCQGRLGIPLTAEG